MVYSRQQLKLRFFDTQPPSTWDRHVWTTPSFPQCPFYGIDGNEEAIRHLCQTAFDAFADPYHDCGNGSFVLVGPVSIAQDLVRIFAALVKLPLIEIQPCQVESLTDVLVEIGKVLERTWIDDPMLGQVSVQLVADGDRITIPPGIVFLEGLEMFPPHVVHGVLAALKHPDRIMATEVGWVVDTSSVCWVVGRQNSISCQQQ